MNFNPVNVALEGRERRGRERVIMVLLRDEGMESQNLARERANKEIEMKMECDNFVSRRFQPEMEMEKKKGLPNEERRIHQEMELEEISEDWKEKPLTAEKGGGGEQMRCNESENGSENVGVEEINGTVRAYGKDMPPVDDLCPICFDRFTVPCRSNCGHWFCASCILQFWMFRSSVQPCKCPLCCCQIVNLKPETCQLIQPAADEIVHVLKKVDQYNGLYVSGALGAFHEQNISFIDVMI